MVLKLAPSGGVISSTVIPPGSVGNGYIQPPIYDSITSDDRGNVYVFGAVGDIYELRNDGALLNVAPAAWFFDPALGFRDPQGLAVDNDGRLFTTVGNPNAGGYVGPIEIVPLPAVPLITLQPQGSTIPFGTNATLSVSAAGTSALSYQWYRDGTAIGGASGLMTGSNAANIFSAAYSATLPGTYAVVVSMATGSVTSAPAVITTVTSGGTSVVAMPTITSQPKAATFSYGGNPLLSVAAVATGPSAYQWQLYGSDLLGATGSSFAATAPGTYTVLATTSAGSVTSNSTVVPRAGRSIFPRAPRWAQERTSASRALSFRATRVVTSRCSFAGWARAWPSSAS